MTTTIERDALAAEFAEVAEGVLERLGRDKNIEADIEQQGFSAAAWAAIVQAGWFETLLPESQGGLGLGLAALGPIFRAVGRHLAAGPVVEHAVALPMVVAQTAAGDARSRLESSLRGRRRMALVDTAGVGGLLILCDGRLDGVVEIVRGAAGADDLLVVANDGGHAAFLAIDASQPGVTIETRESLDPRMSVGRVAFDAVRLDTQARAGARETAADDALRGRIHAGMRLMLGCELAGIADRTLGLAVEYAKQREQFDRPIGSFQAVQHLLAEGARQEFGLARLCADAAKVADERPDQLAIAGLVVKAHGAATARSVAEISLQVHGGVAFTVEHQLHLYYKRLLGLEGYFGGPGEIYRELGHGLLDASRDAWPAW